MKKRIVAIVATLALASSLTAALPAAAADLHFDHVGTVCEGPVCVWHFVNNKTDGAAAGTLDVYFSDTPDKLDVAPTKVLKSVQHFYVEGGKVLEGAASSLPGKLVLSD